VFLFSKVNFLLYGKTWFNRCFNASSLNHKDYQIMKQTILFKKKRDFSKLWYSVLINTGIEKETLEAMYDGAKTYKAFFNTIYDKYGMEPLKIIFYYFPEMTRLYGKINHFYIDLYQKRFITNPRIETLNGMDGMITNPGCV
jgi:hypothetical protein